jgi:tripartite-type tricarboxylate transporter receptor subunit TctC
MSTTALSSVQHQPVRATTAAFVSAAAAQLRRQKSNRGREKVTTILSAAFACLMALMSTAGAQTWPTRTVTMVIPFAAGGPTDVLGRVLAQQMGQILGQSVIVENYGGAGGMSGSRRVVDATPDGYTILMGTVGTHAQNQTLYAKPLYNAETDFKPVILIADVPIALVVRNGLPVNNLKDFLAYTKANQDKMRFASAGTGSATHLACVVVNAAMGVDVTHVPFRGGAPALQEVAAERLDYDCDIISTTKPQIEAKTVKAIAILSQQRSPVLPDLPTAIEQGLNAEAYTWNAIFVPKNTPAEIVKRLHDATDEAINSTYVKDSLARLGAVIVAPDRRSPEYLATFVHSEIEKWAGPIKASGAAGQ